ncbi:hypothetical protein BDR07DRAFT_1353049 [Suillus spraguei]|nr:hypothetical protein BDR07DRAFT_1353049 [Suillus spraguei]
MHAMDPGAHHNPSQSTLTPVSSSRRRSRENETPQQRQKREKAAERQRRKRERDRTVNNINAIMAFTQPTDAQPIPQPQPSQPPTPTFTGQEMTPEELTRRERVRAAARERQRKHRSLVKQRKMRELGLDMPNDMMQGMEEYRVNGDGQYQQVLPHEMTHPPHAMNPQDASFPQAPPPQLTGGQNFASTLLLSFSCAPLLKQHLLRTLAITSEELASLEPIIADAFDQWDHQRRMHYAQQAVAKAADGSISGPSAAPFPNVDMADPASNGFGEPPQPHPSEFRARFHRPLVAPSPFRNFNPDTSTTATTSTPTSTTTSGPPSDPIDPHLNSVVTPGDVRQKSVTALDPDFGQAKGEAEGVAGRLERS